MTATLRPPRIETGIRYTSRLALHAARAALMLSLLTPLFAYSEWKPHTVIQANGNGVPCELPARLQIVTESWNRVVAVPYLAYMPEKDRLLMLASCDYPHQAMTFTSDDHGTSWSDPHYVHMGTDGKGDTGMGVGLTYLGGGKILLFAGSQCWFSHDYGETWGDPTTVPPLPQGQTWNLWDPVFVDRNAAGDIIRLVGGGYSMDTALWESGGTGYSHAHVRFSSDAGRSWQETIAPPQWHGASETTFVRAKNGDLVAACRTDKPPRIKETLDHYEGLATSISHDNGLTWTALNPLYEWGRHHPSMTVMPQGDIVMTYVVRKGYRDAPGGFPQFGIEAVVSHDHGRTWDLDHRYVLHHWCGNRKGPNAWWPSSQATSTVLLPDGTLMTAFGTGYRSGVNDESQNAPRDVGLTAWRLNDKPVNDQHILCLAAFDSDRRNVCDPVPDPLGHETVRKAFFRMCDQACAELNKEITPFEEKYRNEPDPATHHTPFFEDAYVVRALCVAYDMTHKQDYLDACRHWADRVVTLQARMLPQGAYYLNYFRKPGEEQGEWFVADSGSVAAGVLAVAVRVDGTEKTRYLDSAKAFAKLVLANYAGANGGFTDGIWPSFDGEWWCSTATFGTFLFHLYAETRDEQYLQAGLRALHWMASQDMRRAEPISFTECAPGVVFYCGEFFATAQHFLRTQLAEALPETCQAAQPQIDVALQWMAENQKGRGATTSWNYLKEATYMAGMPYVMYVFAQTLPGHDGLVAAAGQELSYVLGILSAPDTADLTHLTTWELTSWAMLSCAEQLSPGAALSVSSAGVPMAE